MVRLADAVNKSSLTTGIPEAHSKAKRNDDTKKVMPSHIKVTSEQIYEALIRYMENVGEQVEMANTFDIEKGVKLIKFLISIFPYKRRHKHETNQNFSASHPHNRLLYPIHPPHNS